MQADESFISRELRNQWFESVIVNHKYKFIFLKTSKTGGFSIEAFLRQFCEPGDIVTSLSDAEERELQSMGLCGPMGHTEIRGKVPLAEREKIRLGDKKATVRYCVVSHSPASRVMEYVGKSVWNSYFKFCIVRHPVDRTISQYFWMAYRRGWQDAETDFTKRFDHFLESKMFQPKLTRKGTGIYMCDGKVVVDYIGKFENLAESLEHTMRQAGVDVKSVELPRLKLVSRPKGNFAEMLLPRQKKIIEKAFEFEFSNFDYKL